MPSRKFLLPSFAQRAMAMVFLTVYTATNWALPGDSQQPINIQSDRAAQKVLQDGTEKTEYFGRVVMTQGSMSINGEHIIIHSKNRKVVKVIAKGYPARFQQQSDLNKSPMKARANDISYQLSQDIVVLANNAIVEQDGNVVSGSRIEYNIAQEKVEAQSGKSKNTRVNVILQPVQKK